MKRFRPCALLMACAGLMQASIVESISFDLSALHAGSTLTGTFTLSDSPMVGDTAPVQLSFSDPSDYSPMSLLATISIGNGTTFPFTVDFSELTFTNPSGNMFTTNVDLMAAGMAQCPSFPCSAIGRFEDRSPAVFNASYTVAPVVVPEPNYGLLVTILLGAIVVGRRVVRPA